MAKTEGRYSFFSLYIYTFLTREEREPQSKAQNESRTFFLLFKDFIYLFIWERAWEGEGQREKQTPFWAGNPIQDSIPVSVWTEGSQSVKQRSHPGIPEHSFLRLLPGIHGQDSSWVGDKEIPRASILRRKDHNYSTFTQNNPCLWLMVTHLFSICTWNESRCTGAEKS